MSDVDKSFGLTDEEYQFLLDDIDQAVAEGNKKYGYGGHGYVDDDRNHYPFPYSNRPTSVRYKRKSKSRKPSIEQLAIARGIIKVYGVNPDPNLDPDLNPNPKNG